MSRKQTPPNSREQQAESNPCFKEAELSLKCLDRNKYDRDKCEAYFANYRSCRQFWSHVQSDREKKGLRPHLPLLAEREATKKEYMQK